MSLQQESEKDSEDKGQSVVSSFDSAQPSARVLWTACALLVVAICLGGYFYLGEPVADPQWQSGINSLMLAIMVMAVVLGMQFLWRQRLTDLHRRVERERTEMSERLARKTQTFPAIPGGFARNSHAAERAESKDIAAPPPAIAEHADQPQLVPAAEQALAEVGQFFQAIVESAPDAIMIQTGGKFAYLNPAALRLLGASGDEFIGRDVVGQFHPHCRATEVDRLWRVNENGEAVPPVEEQLLRCDGSGVDVEVSAVPFACGSQPGSLMLARDISGRKRSV